MMVTNGLVIPLLNHNLKPENNAQRPNAKKSLLCGQDRFGFALGPKGVPFNH